MYLHVIHNLHIYPTEMLQLAQNKCILSNAKQIAQNKYILSNAKQVAQNKYKILNAKVMY